MDVEDSFANQFLIHLMENRREFLRNQNHCFDPFEPISLPKSRLWADLSSVAHRDKSM